MKPSSLATVLIRLVALYIIATGAFMFCAAGVVNFSMRRMVGENGLPSTLTGKVLDFQFPVSSVDTIFMIQVGVAVAVVFGGLILYWLSRGIGVFVGRGLEEREPLPRHEPPPERRQAQLSPERHRPRQQWER